MTRKEPAAPPPVSAKPLQRSPTNPLLRSVRYLAKTLTIAGLEVRKLRHDPTELFTRAVQPMRLPADLWRGLHAGAGHLQR